MIKIPFKEEFLKVAVKHKEIDKDKNLKIKIKKISRSICKKFRE